MAGLGLSTNHFPSHPAEIGAGYFESYIEIQVSLADILHDPATLSVLREGMLVFVEEEGEDNHDSATDVDDGSDRLSQDICNLIGKKHNQEKGNDECVHDH